MIPGKLPANINVAPNSPMERAQVIITPESIWRLESGNVTVKKTHRLELDSIFALLIKSRSMFSNALLADRSISGEATNTCARITANVLPGRVMPTAVNMGPKSPFGAKANSKATPATAGGKTTGISIRVSRMVLLRKLRVANTYAVGTAKTKESNVAATDVSKPKAMASKIAGDCNCIKAW